MLTGSGRDNGFTNKQMVTNDLIRPGNGLSVWNPNNAQGNREFGNPFDQYDDRGVMALYNDNNGVFFVLYYGRKNIAGLLVLDGSNGSLAIANAYVSFFVRNGNFGDQNNLFNGMEWSGAAQDEIVFSGFHMMPSVPPGAGFPFLLRYGLTTGSLWTEYGTQFDGAAYSNIGFDFIVQPINYSNMSTPYGRNQIYYHPKALVLKNIVGPSYVLAGPRQDQSTNFFGLNLLNTGQTATWLPVRKRWSASTNRPHFKLSRIL